MMRIKDEKLKMLESMFFQLEKDLKTDIFIFMQGNDKFPLIIESEKQEYLSDFVLNVNKLYQKEVIIIKKSLFKTLEFYEGPERVRFEVDLSSQLQKDLRKLLMRV